MAELKFKKYVHTLGNLPIAFTNMTVTYGLFRRICKPDYFNPETLSGEQRVSMKKHMMSIRRDLLAGHYSPDTAKIGVRPHHVPLITPLKTKGEFKIDVDENDPLPLIDFNHRLGALELIRKDEGDSIRRMVDDLPIPVLLYLDPEKTQEHFINAQKGKPIDKTQLLAMQASCDLVAKGQGPNYRFAMKVATILKKTVSSPFHNLIRFDSNSKSGLPFHSLAAAGSAALATSLYGLAKVAISYGKDEVWAADQVLAAYEILSSECPDLKEQGFWLCPPPDGSMTCCKMLIGLGVGLAIRLKMKNSDKYDDDDVVVFVEALNAVFSEPMPAAIGWRDLRTVMGEFMDFLTSDLVNPNDASTVRHEGVPVSILSVIPPGSFGLSAIPKEGKKRGRKKKGSEDAQVDVDDDSSDEDVIDQASENRRDSDTDDNWIENDVDDDVDEVTAAWESISANVD